MKAYFQRKRWLIFILSFFILVFIPIKAMAFSTATHRAINEKNADKDSFLHQYLINQLGLKEGVETEINKKWIIKHIGDGGAYEDAGVRSLNHFHNPIKDKGILGQYSALDWATLTVGSQSLSGNYSWYDVRFYYYQALTAAAKSTREDNYAKTFRGLGQVMHLVQDMSVPAHVRRDLHPPPFWNDSYESWAEKKISSSNEVSGYSAHNFIPYDNSLLIRQLFDTDQYSGTNPSITILNNIGLAEFTNANFLSADTIFKDFNYPDKNNLQMYPKEVSPGKWAVYYTKTIDGLGEVKHFVREKSYYDRLPSSEAFHGLMLDDRVHADYAQHLIPRAVGYSSQVLSYFFRGQLEAEFVEGNLKVKNTSSETISNGEFSLYYDTASEERNLLVTVHANNLSPGSEQTINLPQMPEGATSFMLVYKGKLGNEFEAVIGKFIHAERPVIYVEIGNQCIVWDVVKKKMYDKVTTNSSTPENPEYATFPCDRTSVSNWRVKQIAQDKYERDNLSMKPCGRVGAITDGTEAPQMCSCALDAKDAMDTGLQSLDANAKMKSWTHNYINYSSDCANGCGEEFTRSKCSIVNALNSSIWYRVKEEFDGFSKWVDVGYPGCGDAQKSNTNLKWLLSFYAIGEPFREPFFEMELYRTVESDYYCSGYENYSSKESYDFEQLAPHTIYPGNKYYNSAITKLAWSEKLIFHVTHLAVVMRKQAGSYDVPDPGGSLIPFGYFQPRIQGLKVNLDYKNDGIGETYNLGNMPAAPEELKIAIQDLINKMYEDSGIPENETTEVVYIYVTFYNIKQ